MPRLSVDIDLTYLPLEDRNTTLINISDSLDRIATSIVRSHDRIKVQRSLSNATKHISKLVVSSDGVQIKIEPNEIIRGAVFEPKEMELCSAAEEIFEKTVSIRTLSFEDLYGGKLCAALDRQHPRDIFDMKILLDHEGITEGIRKAFLVYLVCHDRPINELIQPTRKDIRTIFEREFLGMSNVNVSLAELTEVRERYITGILNSLTDDDKKFLVTMKEGRPDWNLLGLSSVERLPAVQWKLKNIHALKKVNQKKHEDSLAKLKKKLGF